MIETLRNLFADVLQQPMPEFTPATAFADAHSRVQLFATP